MRKQDFVMDEEFKKRLLSKVFDNGYAKTPDCAFAEKYCGYCGHYGDFPMEVEFYGNSLMFVKRMDHPRKSATSNKVMAEFAQGIAGTEGLEADKLYTMDFEGLEMKLDFDHMCILINFLVKEKEDVA